MNRQEVYEKVVRHLLKQGEKSQRGTNCRYRDGHGRSCAIGCLIPDELYSEVLEGRGVDAALVQRVIQRAGYEIGDQDLDFLCSLQNIHDGYAVAEWPVALRTFATSYTLRVPKELT